MTLERRKNESLLLSLSLSLSPTLFTLGMHGWFVLTLVSRRSLARSPGADSISIISPSDLAFNHYSNPTLVQALSLFFSLSLYFVLAVLSLSYSVQRKHDVK